MKDTHFIEQDDSYTAAFPFTDFGPKLLQKPFNVAPLNIGTDRMSADCFKRSLMLSLHVLMVLQISTIGPP